MNDHVWGLRPSVRCKDKADKAKQREEMSKDVVVVFRCSSCKALIVAHTICNVLHSLFQVF
jgi:ribosomal protein L32